MLVRPRALPSRRASADDSAALAPTLCAMSRPLRVCSVDLERGWRGGEQQVFLLQRGLREIAAGEIESTVLARAGEPLAERLAAAGLGVWPAESGYRRFASLRRVSALS